MTLRAAQPSSMTSFTLYFSSSPLGGMVGDTEGSRTTSLVSNGQNFNSGPTTSQLWLSLIKTLVFHLQILCVSILVWFNEVKKIRISAPGRPLALERKKLTSQHVLPKHASHYWPVGAMRKLNSSITDVTLLWQSWVLPKKSRENVPHYLWKGRWFKIFSFRP